MGEGVFETLPREFGSYTLTARLGTGGVAQVFRATTGNGTHKREVAVKLITVDGNDHQLEDMLLDEARIWRRLKHPNIVEVLEFGMRDQDWFFALELVEGVSLAELLKRTDVLPVDEALLVAERVALGLAHAHTKTDEKGAALSIVHRDVKPANILISNRGQVKLTDFGIARAADRISRTQVGVVKGSIYFLSPEQARGETVDARCDLFSLGCVLHVALTGGALIDEEDDQAIFDALASGRIPPPPPNLPATVRALLSSLTAANPADRPPSAAEAARRIRASAEGLDLDALEPVLARRVQTIQEELRKPAPAASSEPTNTGLIAVLPPPSSSPPPPTPPQPALSRATPGPAGRAPTPGSTEATVINAAPLPLRPNLASPLLRRPSFAGETTEENSITTRRTLPAAEPSVTLPAIRVPGGSPRPRATDTLRAGEALPAAPAEDRTLMLNPRGQQAPRSLAAERVRRAMKSSWEELQSLPPVAVLVVIGVAVALLAMLISGPVYSRLVAP